MQERDIPRAIAATAAVASSAGLPVEDVTVLQASNKLALRLLPCDVMARVAIGEDLQRELDLAGQLVAAGAPVAAPESRAVPGVHHRDGFAITLWTYYPGTGEVSARDYAGALRRLHAAMRTVESPVPHARDRVGSAIQLLTGPRRSPELAEADRALLTDTLRRLGPVLGDGAGEQLLHGEPHPGNLLGTEHGPVFIDLETCCRGPVEFDLAHAPDDVAEHYPGIDAALLEQCRILVLAMITAWRWDRDDRLPDGRRLAHEWLAQLRALR